MFNKDKLIELFGKEWYEVLSEYISGKDFYQLACKITELRKTKEIYPISANIFRCFRETPYNKVKVVIVGQEPMKEKNYNDGLAFSNSLSKDISSTLKVILKEVDNCYPENIDRIDYGRLDLQDLSRWSSQGCLLLNIALTIERGKVASHLDIWKNFTEEVFKTLNLRNDIIICFLGKEAKMYSKLINNPTITIMRITHPSAELYSPNQGFLNSNIFKDINAELSKRNLKEIIW
jgi:uracil-DNA glycosylase